MSRARVYEQIKGKARAPASFQALIARGLRCNAKRSCSEVRSSGLYKDEVPAALKERVSSERSVYNIHLLSLYLYTARARGIRRCSQHLRPILLPHLSTSLSRRRIYPHTYILSRRPSVYTFAVLGCYCASLAPAMLRELLQLAYRR